MNKLIEDCTEHNYLYLKRTNEVITEPNTKVVPKEIYACADCGSGKDVYYLDEAIEVKDPSI